MLFNFFFCRFNNEFRLTMMLFIYPLPFQPLLLFHALFLLILKLIFKFPLTLVMAKMTVMWISKNVQTL